MCLVNRRGLGEARRHAECVGTGGIQFRQVRHEEGRLERERRRLDGETSAEIENRAAHEHFMGYEFMRTETKSVEVPTGENMMVLQIAAFAVGHLRWMGGIRVPVMNSMDYVFCK